MKIQKDLLCSTRFSFRHFSILLAVTLIGFLTVAADVYGHLMPFELRRLAEGENAAFNNPYKVDAASPTQVAYAMSPENTYLPDDTNMKATGYTIAPSNTAQSDHVNISRAATAVVSGNLKHLDGSEVSLAVYSVNQGINDIYESRHENTESSDKGDYRNDTRDGPFAATPDGKRGESCNFELSENQVTVSASGGRGIIRVQSTGPCGWNLATQGISWLTFTDERPGSGNGTVEYTILPNMAASVRIAAITVATKIFTITQYGIGKNYAANY